MSSLPSKRKSERLVPGRLRSASHEDAPQADRASARGQRTAQKFNCVIAPARQPSAGGFFFPAGSHNAEPRVPASSYGCAAPGEDVMANLSIRDLLLLTCIGTFIASATYAVTLLIEAI